MIRETDNGVGVIDYETTLNDYNIKDIYAPVCPRRFKTNMRNANISTIKDASSKNSHLVTAASATIYISGEFVPDKNR